MELLILGLALFLGVHLVPMIVPLRQALFGALGEKGYKLAFSLVSAVGLVLIVIGYGRAPHEPQLFAPSVGARHALPLVMMVSFALLAASHMKGRIRLAVKHPMLIGVGLWALAHLLANGHLKATLLFGGFLAYVVIDFISATARGTAKTFTPVPRQDVIAVVAGVVLALVVMSVHRYLFGVPAVPWGL